MIFFCALYALYLFVIHNLRIVIVSLNVFRGWASVDEGGETFFFL